MARLVLHAKFNFKMYPARAAYLPEDFRQKTFLILGMDELEPFEAGYIEFAGLVADHPRPARADVRHPLFGLPVPNANVRPVKRIGDAFRRGG